MKNCLLVGDTHLGIYKSADLWHDATILLFKEIIDVCKKRCIDRIIHLGDFFDNRRHLNIKTLSNALKIAELLHEAKLEVFIIIGNHDTFYKDKIHPTSLSVFEEHPNIKIIDEVTVMEDMVMVPWATEMKDIPDARYALGHFEINGFPVVQRFEFYKSDINITNFSRFEQVFSGHFHIPSHKNNITYLGAPFQFNFGDAGSKRGYYVFEDDKLEFIQYKDAPEFVVVTTDEQIKPEKIRGNIVKLVYKKDYGTSENMKILEQVQIYQPIQLFTDFARMSSNIVSANGDDTENIQLKSTRDILTEYIEKMEKPDHIKIATLRQVISGLLKEDA
jgi:DNA repair exonuclease SbcCD nuclease subunit